MTFENLPDNWSDQPLDTPGLAADVADLFVGMADREGGCVCLLLTDRDRRLAQPYLVGAVPEDADPGDLSPVLVELAGLLGDGAGAMVFVRGRAGSSLVTDADRRWHEMVRTTCRQGRLDLIGAFLATPSGVRAFPAALTEADLAS
jgi:hypothetical protein